MLILLVSRYEVSAFNVSGFAGWILSFAAMLIILEPPVALQKIRPFFRNHWNTSFKGTDLIPLAEVCDER